MLSQTLQSLERDGLLVREVRSAIPPRRLLAHGARRRGGRAAPRPRRPLRGLDRAGRTRPGVLSPRSLSPRIVPSPPPLEWVPCQTPRSP
ncbi:hypothetical protein [Demequina sediminis]|uniref:hypothetical protein n=1 Tax=Demequina sediminis TaxID=1930058 RepID=UPI003305E3C0